MLGETLSFGLPGNNINYGYDLSTSPRVGVIIVARAADESRALFPYTSPGYSDGTVPKNVIELEFPGAHSDIGGGYASGEGGINNDLSRVILNEVVNVAVANGVPFGAIPPEYQAAPETMQAYNNYIASKAAYNANPADKNAETAYRDAYSNLYDNYVHDSRMWFDLDNNRKSYYPNDVIRSQLPQNQF